MQPTRWAVKLVTATDRTGGNSTYTLAYTYEGARREVQGRGFLGFAKRIAIDSRLGYNLKSEDVYLQSFPYTGLLASTTLKQSSGTKVREQINTWTPLTWAPPEPRYYPYLSSSVTRDFEVSAPNAGTQYRAVTTSVAAISSVSGLVTDATTTTTEVATGVNASSSRSERVWHSSVFDDTSNWCLGRPQTTQVIASHSLTDGNAVTRTTGGTWDGPMCRLTSRSRNRGTARCRSRRRLATTDSATSIRWSVAGIGMTSRPTTGTGARAANLPDPSTNALSQTTTLNWNRSVGEMAAPHRPERARDELGVRHVRPADERGPPGPDEHGVDLRLLRHLRSRVRYACSSSRRPMRARSSARTNRATTRSTRR